MLGDFLLQGLDWTGRARRRDLWAFVAVAGVLLAAFVAAEVWIAGDAPQAPRFVYLAAALCVVPGVSLGVRRLHDRGHGGGWLVLGLVPWIGLAVLAYLLLAPGKGRVDAPETPVAFHLLGGVLVAVLVVLVASRAFWAPYWFPTGSMKPTLLIGDYATVSYGVAAGLARGDVIVFRSGEQASVGRVIGMAGDQVQMRDGKVVLNGVEIPQAEVEPLVEINAPQGPGQHLPRCGNAPVGAGGHCVTNRLRETTATGISYTVLDLMPGTAMDDTSEVTVPEGRLFVLGDNRDDSLDSRFARDSGGAGLVDGADVIGKLRRIIFSAEGRQLLAFWDWRAGRYWQAVE